MDWRRHVRPVLTIAGAHYLFSLAFMLVFWHEVMHFTAPQPALFAVLSTMTAAGPAGLLGQIPVPMGALAMLMVLQSLVFGAIGYRFLHAAHQITHRRSTPLRAIAFTLACGLTLAAWLAIGAAAGCGFPGMRLQADSREIRDRDEQAYWVHRALGVPGRPEATAFLLHGSSGAIGPSSWAYDVAVKVPPEDVDRWLTQGRFPCTRLVKDAPGTTALPDEHGTPSTWPLDLSAPVWAHSSAPEVYTCVGSSDAEAVVYRPEGIIVFSVSSG